MVNGTISYIQETKLDPFNIRQSLSRNIPKEFKTILSNCLTHARRNEKLDIMGSQSQFPAHFMPF